MSKVFIECTVDSFTGKITDDLTIQAKKGDKLLVSEKEWEVIQGKYKKWFTFVEEVKVEVKLKEKVKEVPEDKAYESPYNKMFPVKDIKNK